ncbi:MAG: hypothetical protein WAU77_06540 [Solirubrobacteraceae bacterium]
MANSQDKSSSQHPDLLAAVVLHTLVSGACDGMTAASVALACERDPSTQREIDEIMVALEILLEDGLAERETAPERKPDATRESGAAQPGTARKPDTTHEPDIPPQPIYRPTRAAIRASELSF